MTTHINTVNAQLRKRVMNLLSYEPKTGHFRWKVARGKASVGMIAGRVQSGGYLQIRVDQRIYYAHRLAWLVTTGRFPPHQIDHINGIKDDNRIANLRAVTPSMNLHNRQGPQINNGTGLLGVCLDQGRYRAQIQANGKKKHLGRFKTPDAAYAAYLEAKRDIT